jgi:Plavaka transposase
MASVQDQLPEGATIVPMIVASDKTPVTRHTGGLEMHPIFVTIANIQSDVRMRATCHAWRCVAYMPIPKFVDVHPDYQTILSQRLFHKCMDIVFADAKVAAMVGKFMPDPARHLRHCFTPLVTYTADLPEQQAIACVSKVASLITLATSQSFGDTYRHPPRTKEHTLTAIYNICQRIDPWRLREFQEEAKAHSLSGIHQPFWWDWRHSDPSRFLVGEILHTCHKFFFDHPFKWCKESVGKDELDLRFRSHHKRVGTRHFSSGVCQMKQMTGREHRDLQCTLVPSITGVVPPVCPCDSRFD